MKKKNEKKMKLASSNLAPSISKTNLRREGCGLIRFNQRFSFMKMCSDSLVAP